MKIKITAIDDYRTFKAGDEHTIDFAEQSNIFMVGDNGCGKSTLINALRGVKNDNKGRGKCNGFESGITTDSYKEISSHFKVECDFEKVVFLSAEADDPLSWANTTDATAFIECGGFYTNRLSTGQREQWLVNKWLKENMGQLDDKTLVIFDECEKGMDAKQQRIWAVIGNILWAKYGCKSLKISHNIFEISLQDQVYSFKDKAMVNTKQWLLDMTGYEIEKPKFVKK